MALKGVPKEAKCGEKDCNNIAYAYDNITPNWRVLVCRKHYYMFNYGYSEYEASKK